MFTLNEIGRSFIKCGRVGSTDEDLIRVDVSLQEATFFVSFQRQDAKWPYRIDNGSDEDIVVWQSTKDPKMYIVPKLSSMPYAWDNPTAEAKRLLVSVGGEETQIDLLKFGSHDDLSFPISSHATGIMGFQVVAEGPIVVLRIRPVGAAQDKTFKRRRSTRTSQDEERRRVEEIVAEKVCILMLSTLASKLMTLLEQKTEIIV
jgi:vacuolar protein sorting-associated protein 13A/C